MNFRTGLKYIIYHIRLNYWIPSLWTVIDNVIKLCPTCDKRKAEKELPAPAPSELQPYRFKLERTSFIHSFIDILGPIITKDMIWLNTVGEEQTASNHPIKKVTKRKNVNLRKYLMM